MAERNGAGAAPTRRPLGPARGRGPRAPFHASVARPWPPRRGPAMGPSLGGPGAKLEGGAQAPAARPGGRAAAPARNRLGLGACGSRRGGRLRPGSARLPCTPMGRLLLVSVSFHGPGRLRQRRSDCPCTPPEVGPSVPRGLAASRETAAARAVVRRSAAGADSAD